MSGDTFGRESRKQLPVKRIALLHHTGWGNLGDDAVVNAVFKNIRSRWTNTSYAILSMNPCDTELRHALPSHPIRSYQFGYGLEPSPAGGQRSKGNWLRTWLEETRNPLIRIPKGVVREILFLRRSYTFIRSFHYLILTGGGQLTERGGSWSFPYALFVWSFLAKRAGLKFMLLSVGAGPLKRPLSRFFVLRTLNRADYVSFRDQESQDLVQRLGFKRTADVYPDNAYSYPEVPVPKHLVGSVVGIAPMPFPFGDLLKCPDNGQEIQDEFIEKLAIFARLVSSSAFSFRLFGSDIRSDPPEIERLRAVLLARHGISVPEYEPVYSISELLNRMSEMDYVVTCRLHGVISAHLLNKPVLAIAHHPKVTHLMGALGLSKYCLEMEGFDPVQMFDRFQSLVANREDVKAMMAKKLDEFHAKSAEQFDRLFPQDGLKSQGPSNRSTHSTKFAA